MHLIPNFSVIYLANFLSYKAKLALTSFEITFFSKNFLSFFGILPSIKALVEAKASFVSLNLENASKFKLNININTIF